MLEKKILKLFLGLFLFFTIFRIFAIFKIDLPFNLNELAPSFLSVTYILAFCFSYQKEENSFAKIGMFLVLLNLILRVISVLFCDIQLLLKYATLFVWISRIISISSSVCGLLYFVVLFNLIDSNNVMISLCKMITVLLSVISIFMNVLEYIFVKLYSNVVFGNIYNVISQIVFFAEYSVFFLYLIERTNDSTILQNNSVQSSVGSSNVDNSVSQINMATLINSVGDNSLASDNNSLVNNSVMGNVGTNSDLNNSLLVNNSIQNNNTSLETNSNSLLNSSMMGSVNNNSGLNNISNINKSNSNNNLAMDNSISFDAFMNSPIQDNDKNSNSNNNM